MASRPEVPKIASGSTKFALSIYNVFLTLRRQSAKPPPSPDAEAQAGRRPHGGRLGAGLGRKEPRGGAAGDYGKADVDGAASGRPVKQGGPGYSAQGASIPAPGPMSKRVSCEPAGGLTSLTEEPITGEQMLRKDGEL